MCTAQVEQAGQQVETSTPRLLVVVEGLDCRHHAQRVNPQPAATLPLIEAQRGEEALWIRGVRTEAVQERCQ